MSADVPATGAQRRGLPLFGLCSRLLEQNRSRRLCCYSLARQPNRELGENALFAVDRDRAAVLLRHDIIADRETEAGPLARRLGGEERLEQFVPDFRGNADAVVPHPDLDRIAGVVRRHAQHRAESGHRH